VTPTPTRTQFVPASLSYTLYGVYPTLPPQAYAGVTFSANATPAPAASLSFNPTLSASSPDNPFMTIYASAALGGGEIAVIIYNTARDHTLFSFTSAGGTRKYYQYFDTAKDAYTFPTDFFT
jgi:hypothetical protein